MCMPGAIILAWHAYTLPPLPSERMATRCTRKAHQGYVCTLPCNVCAQRCLLMHGARAHAPCRNHAEICRISTPHTACLVPDA